MELSQILKIKKIVNENYKVKTFFLDKKINSKPGQFVMVWLPGVDEKPFVLSHGNAITVEKKGMFTENIFKLKTGDKIGVRGPFGNGFTVKENACVVAGGLGIVPLSALIKKLKDPTIIYGAKTKDEYIFKGKLKKIIYCTDDGSYGFKGFVSDKLKEVLKERKFKVVYCCGPEMMIKKVFDICEENKIEMQASLERYMKCGFGVCGSCVINDNLVCKDGPVFNSRQLRKLTELGKFARLKSGKKVSLKEYYSYKK